MISARVLAIVSVFFLTVVDPGRAADLPPHGPLRILVVSDEVNPHSLLPPELTQPGDISAALGAMDSGLNIDPAADGLVEHHTSSLASATAALAVPFGSASAYDVLVYFAHRDPVGDTGEQAAFVAATEAFLVAGGGVVSFHHGSYGGPGKAAMMELIGATATGDVPWNTVEGQNVINVSPGHFVTSHEVEYPGSLAYADPAHGVAAGVYPSFTNIPDERYPEFAVNPTAGNLEVLFGSDYDDHGTTHLLGFTHRMPGWLGVVVAYQPGEYQPNALDDRDGNGFQILANAIVYAAGQAPSAVPALTGFGASLTVLWIALIGARRAQRV